MNKLKKMVLYVVLVSIIACIIWSMMYKENERIIQEKIVYRLK